MPRNNAPAASTLRNRNRITNKTRLKIHQGSLDADAVLIPDEDDERHRLTNLVAGVDAEDANEHHLQQVLSAAHRTSTTRLSNRVVQPPPAVYIPTPDSTGIVANYDDLYPSSRWKDPVTYVCTSQTAEESVVNGISGGFTYYMDDRDKEWLDKNNEEARGEGTSAQGAVSISGTRTSVRSAKAKGKEPESLLPVVISEDEFELAMGIFEKVTHERTEFLHHGLENGMDFPVFSEYQDVFSVPLPISVFANYSPPSWIPNPPALLRIAKAIYPYWKERRLERGGHRIIPTLNGDESDTLNESYVCFRRRESKSVRKTRASQVTSSDKLARLQIEFHYPLEIAKAILSRETVKKEVAQQAQAVWEKRLAFVDLKRKFPTLNDKLDEELLVDKERPMKKPDPSRPGLKLKTTDGGRGEPVIRPKDRIALIRDQIETTLERQKSIDHHWEDLVDNPYQPPIVPYPSKLFKFVPPPEGPVWPTSIADKTSPPLTPHRRPRAVRMRHGRGGRIFLDCRDPTPQRVMRRLPRSSLFTLEEDETTESEGAEDAEIRKRREERWKFDVDDMPPVGPDGIEEHERQLIDDYDTGFLRHAMTLHTESDHIHLVTDPTLVVFNSEGRPQGVVPYRLGGPSIIMRRDAQGIVRPMLPAHVQHMLALQNGTPLAIPPHLKKMQPSVPGPQMRISSGGGMRPPAVSAANSQHQSSPPQPLLPQSQSSIASPIVNQSPPAPSPIPVPQHAVPNGIGRPAISMPHVEVPKTDAISAPALLNGVVNGVTPPQSDANGDTATVGTPARPKSQNRNSQGHIAIPSNGYHLPLSAALLNTTYLPQNGQHGLSLQQVQNLKSAFANLSATEMAALNGGRPLPASYLMPNMQSNANINLKLPNARQAQWAMAAQLQQQRPSSVVNGMDGQLNGVLANGMVAVSPTLSQSVPVRTPSANGQRVGLRNGVHVNGQQHTLSPHVQASPTLPNISQSQSPPRISLAPSMGLPSPSLQQPVGSNQNGY